MNDWFLSLLGGIFEWILKIPSWFLSQHPLWQLLILAALLGFGLWVDHWHVTPGIRRGFLKVTWQKSLRVVGYPVAFVGLEALGLTVVAGAVFYGLWLTAFLFMLIVEFYVVLFEVPIRYFF
ncbi:MAG: hypothetical protein HYU48_02315 [Candidatus Levybacteria bacterium]|nr:hypothetical protein [Candidatus Levybacteria bacterium]